MKLQIVEQVPEQVHRPVAIYMRTLLGRNPRLALDGLSVSRTQHQALHRFVRAVFAPYRADGRVVFIDLSEGLCQVMSVR